MKAREGQPLKVAPVVRSLAWIAAKINLPGRQVHCRAAQPAGTAEPGNTPKSYLLRSRFCIFELHIADCIKAHLLRSHIIQDTQCLP